MNENEIQASELEEWLKEYGNQFDRCNCGSDYIRIPPGFVYKIKLDNNGKVISVSKIDMSCYSMFSATPYCDECNEEIE